MTVFEGCPDAVSNFVILRLSDIATSSWHENETPSGPALEQRRENSNLVKTAGPIRNGEGRNCRSIAVDIARRNGKQFSQVRPSYKRAGLGKRRRVGQDLKTASRASQFSGSKVELPHVATCNHNWLDWRQVGHPKQ